MTRNLLMLAVAFLAVSACGPKKGSTAPGGKSQAEVDAERERVAKAAKANGLIELANEDLANGRFVSARKRAEEALASNPADADAHAVLGAAAWRAGDFEASTQAYRAGVEVDPENFGAALGLARNLQASGDHKEALRITEVIVGAESKGFTETACGSDGTCEVGVCDVARKMCKPAPQVAPRFTKLWSQYLMLDAQAASITLDDIFLGIGADEGELGIARSYASFIRPLVGKADLLKLVGDKGVTGLGYDASNAVKHAAVKVGEKSTRAVVSELQIECRIDERFAKALQLAEIGKVKPVGTNTDQGFVMIPSISIGDMTIENVPALVQDNSFYEAGVGEVPGLVLGRHLIERMGSITFDVPGATMELTKAAPETAPAAAADVAFLTLDLRSLQIPVVPVGLDGSAHKIWTWFGGIYPSAITVTAREYLHSGHRPAEVENPDDLDRGLKMVFVESVDLAGKKVEGVGGLVLTHTPPDSGIDSALQASGFPLGGYINAALLQHSRVTFVPSRGRLWIDFQRQ